jgi:hypothetical protein
VTKEGLKPDFDFNGHVGAAMATLEEDERLAQLRHRLVPSRISEECFWAAYFREVTVIKHALLIDYSKANQEHRKTHTIDPSQDDILAELERELQIELEALPNPLVILPEPDCEPNPEGFEDYSYGGLMSPTTDRLAQELLGASPRMETGDVGEMHL